MNPRTAPVRSDIVLVGGGHAHVSVLKRFGMRPTPGARITLIARDIMTPYSGMLPGFVAGHYDRDTCHIDLGPLARFANARLIHGEAVGIDLERQRVRLADRPPIDYDFLSIDIGSRPKQTDVPGSDRYAIPVKPIDRFIGHWEDLRMRVTADHRPMRIGVVGGGAGGVELLLAMRYRLRQELAAYADAPARLTFVLVAKSNVLESHPLKVRRAFEKTLSADDIEVHPHSEVIRVEPGRLILADQRTVTLDEILWVTQASTAPWLRESGLACDDGGFVRVRETLQTVSADNVFAAGDCAAVDLHPRPKAGVFAVRQGPPLATNLERMVRGEAPRPFRPQRNFLTLISTGERYAVAARGHWAAKGRLWWTLKDHIDRRFMRKFSDLPTMSDAPSSDADGRNDRAALDALSETPMRCGGCGAKVGADVLNRALARLEVTTNEDVVIGLRAPDDAAVVRLPAGKLAVHTVDYFRTFIDDPYLFGRIAANHALGDLYAMGATPHTALAIATLPYGIESKIEADLFQLLAGALSMLREADCTLIGGHTSEGAELALGFALNGLIDEESALRKSSVRVGQSLILTKPIGTGTLFAAAMRGKAKGPWIDAALASMQVSQRTAARCLQAHGATAATDVTGFGLLGHLVEMLSPAQLGATIDLAAVPVLDGALATVAAGIFSSLQPANLRLRRAVRDAEPFARDPRFALLFDPQTAGGLLASVPAERASACIDALRQSGYPRAANIGTITGHDNGVERIALHAG